MVLILFTADKECDNSATQFFSVTKGWKAEKRKEIKESQENSNYEERERQ